MRFPALLVAAALAAAVPASAQMPEPDDGPKARELYIGCSLMLRHADVGPSNETPARPYSAMTCGRVSMEVFFQGGPREGEPYSWCPSHGSGITVEEWRPMLRTFLDYFERHAPDVADRDGRTVYLEALRQRWPCAARPRR